MDGSRVIETPPDYLERPGGLPRSRFLGQVGNLSAAFTHLDGHFPSIPLNHFICTDSEWVRLCSVLQTSKQITSIVLHNTPLSTERSQTLGDTISCMFWLKELDMYVNSDVRSWFSVSVVHPLLPTVSNLETLKLSGVDMTTSDATKLSETLVENKVIRGLDISNNSDIGDEGCLAIIKALRRHPRLRLLNMGSTGMTDDTVEAIATDLLPSLQSRRLERLDLNDNPGIGNRGALALAKALRRDGKGNGVKVETVYLYKCGIAELHREWLQCPEGIEVNVWENPIQTRLSVEMASAFLSHDMIRGLEECRGFSEANNIPASYCDNTKDALRYIVLAGDSRTQLFRGRVVMIGDYGQGKSCLVRNMCADDDWFKQWTDEARPPPLPSTRAMESTELGIDHATVLVQDLGGQQIYRALQPLLLHGCPLYIYCVDLSCVSPETIDTCTQRLQLWLDVLVSGHASDGTRLRVMIVATHVDLIGDLDIVKARLQILRDIFLAVAAENRGDDGRIVVELDDRLWAVDNDQTFECSYLDLPENLLEWQTFSSFPVLATYVCKIALDTAKQRYDPAHVPKRWVSVYNLVRSKEGVLIPWSELAQEAKQLDPPISSDGELEFVFRLVREWTGIVHFRDRVPATQSTDAQQQSVRDYVFLSGDWFVQVAGSLFIIHHHFAHAECDDIRSDYNVTMHTDFEGDFECDTRKAPSLPRGMYIEELDNDGELHSLLEECTMSRDLLFKLTKDARHAMGLGDDSSTMDLVIGVLEALDIIMRLPPKFTSDASSERYLCPSLASTITAKLDGAMDRRIQDICARGLHREYKLRPVLNEVFFRIVVKVCRRLRDSGTFVTQPVVLGYDRALWKAPRATTEGKHYLLLLWEQGRSSRGPELRVWTLGESSAHHPFLSLLEQVLAEMASFMSAIPDKPVLFCPKSSCRGSRVVRLQCRVCETDHSEAELLYGPTAPNSVPASTISLPSTGFVFVSYKWNSDTETVPAKWVQQELVPELRRRVPGRKIVLDLDPESVAAQNTEGKNVWMARMVDEAALVLVVCSPGYLKSTRICSGVYFEYMQILNRLQDPAKPVLPILPAGAKFEESVPSPLKIYITLQYPEQADDLVHILGSKGGASKP